MQPAEDDTGLCQTEADMMPYNASRDERTEMTEGRPERSQRRSPCRFRPLVPAHQCLFADEVHFMLSPFNAHAQKIQVGDGAKWRITNLKQVADAITRCKYR
jgi:hypothetical protein